MRLSPLANQKEKIVVILFGERLMEFFEGSFFFLIGFSFFIRIFFIDVRGIFINLPAREEKIKLNIF